MPTPLVDLSKISEEQEMRIVNLAMFAIQATPPAVVLKHEGEADELVKDDVYHLRQAAARVLLARLNDSALSTDGFKQ